MHIGFRNMHLRQKRGHLGDVDKLNLALVLDLAEQPVLLLLKVRKLLAGPQSLHQGSFTTKNKSLRMLDLI
jgi:hypothetical protein